MQRSQKNGFHRSPQKKNPAQILSTRVRLEEVAVPAEVFWREAPGDQVFAVDLHLQLAALLVERDALTQKMTQKNRVLFAVMFFYLEDYILQ
jgi:hypothetical protein